MTGATREKPTRAGPFRSPWPPELTNSPTAS
jgi:hypothetical protein